MAEIQNAAGEPGTQEFEEVAGDYGNICHAGLIAYLELSSPERRERLKTKRKTRRIPSRLWLQESRHWWLEDPDGDRVIDLTVRDRRDNSRYPYSGDNAYAQMSNRAREIIRRVEERRSLKS